MIIIIAQAGKTTRIRQAFEELLVQTYVAKPSIERFYEGARLRLTGVDGMPANVTRILPFEHGAQTKVVATYRSCTKDNSLVLTSWLTVVRICEAGIIVRSGKGKIACFCFFDRSGH